MGSSLSVCKGGKYEGTRRRQSPARPRSNKKSLLQEAGVCEGQVTPPVLRVVFCGHYVWSFLPVLPHGPVFCKDVDDVVRVTKHRGIHNLPGGPYDTHFSTRYGVAGDVTPDDIPQQR
ncbi:hypothetical protein Pmani_034410 [Petrolisthes manimaculis]|uniref:Uncharacterized protein n=1 Tax=Petrolisthes manimaculis TaxID=1843537 RepID=A0AAE1TPF5_9EUCA|nr:hypothetical protein Pmani_034410 [Petrolisthes manimaculis]